METQRDFLVCCCFLFFVATWCCGQVSPRSSSPLPWAITWSYTVLVGGLCDLFDLSVFHRCDHLGTWPGGVVPFVGVAGRPRCSSPGRTGSGTGSNCVRTEYSTRRLPHSPGGPHFSVQRYMNSLTEWEKKKWTRCLRFVLGTARVTSDAAWALSFGYLSLLFRMATRFPPIPSFASPVNCIGPPCGPPASSRGPVVEVMDG